MSTESIARIVASRAYVTSDRHLDTEAHLFGELRSALDRLRTHKDMASMLHSVRGPAQQLEQQMGTRKYVNEVVPYIASALRRALTVDHVMKTFNDPSLLAALETTFGKTPKAHGLWDEVRMSTYYQHPELEEEAFGGTGMVDMVPGMDIFQSTLAALSEESRNKLVPDFKANLQTELGKGQGYTRVAFRAINEVTGLNQIFGMGHGTLKLMILIPMILAEKARIMGGRDHDFFDFTGGLITRNQAQELLKEFDKDLDDLSFA